MTYVPFEDLFDDFVMRQIQLSRTSFTLGNRVRGMLEELYDELLGEMVKIDPTGHPKWRDQRLLRLGQTVEPLIRGTYDTISGDMSKSLTGVAGSEARWISDLFQRGAGGRNILDVALTHGDLKRLADGTLIQGAVSKDWWAGQDERTREHFMSEVRKGALRGESIDEMARRIRGKPTGRRFSWYNSKGQHRWHVEFEGGVMDVNTREAKALVRTSVMAVGAQTRREMYLANDDVVKGIQQISTLDTRTTPICMAYDGEWWEFGDEDHAEAVTQAGQQGSPGPPMVNLRDRFPQLSGDVMVPEGVAVGEAMDAVGEQLFDLPAESCVVFDADGTPLFAKSGSSRAITFTGVELRQMQGGYFIHNHPSGSGLSIDDVVFATRNNMAEIRAVGRSRLGEQRVTYRLARRGDEWWDQMGTTNAYLQKTYQIHHQNTMSVFNTLIDAGDMTPVEAQMEHYHVVWDQVAREMNLLTAVRDAGGIEYERIIEDLAGPSLGNAADRVRELVEELERQLEEGGVGDPLPWWERGTPPRAVTHTVMREEFKDWAEKLTDRQIDALSEYSGEGYTHINAFMRQGESYFDDAFYEALDEWGLEDMVEDWDLDPSKFSDEESMIAALKDRWVKEEFGEVRQQAKDLERALKKGKLPESIQVYRSMNLSYYDLGALPEPDNWRGPISGHGPLSDEAWNKAVREWLEENVDLPTFVDPGFPSATINPDDALQFLEGERDLVKILLPKGTRGGYLEAAGGLTGNPGEHEFLLAPGYEFEVIGVERKLVGGEWRPILVLALRGR